ncbi:hypothetical protein HYS97_00315 [Candidatus Daviesbacteria bacterium]|nr:hypothetical protein [Candidatus Daviesbacteria bacterium]
MDDKKLIEELLQRIYSLEARVSKLERITVTHHRAIIKRSLEPKNEILEDAVRVLRDYDFISTPLLQKRLKVGYTKALRVMTELEREGLISKGNEESPRRVLLIKDS